MRYLPFLDSLSIPKLPNGRRVDRDGLVPWRRHAYVMSHAYSKLDFIDYIQIRNDNKNPILQQQKKDRELALKVVNRAAIVKHREDLAASDKLMKTAAKAAEKVRRQNLTAADRRVEDQSKNEQSPPPQCYSRLMRKMPNLPKRHSSCSHEFMMANVTCYFQFSK